METVIARLKTDAHGDRGIMRLISLIEQDRARLVASILGAQATGQEPLRIEGTSPARPLD
ncbi:MAG TPA: hypothetical protein VF091_04625 [Gaiellaceae bacterium]